MFQQQLCGLRTNSRTNSFISPQTGLGSKSVLRTIQVFEDQYAIRIFSRISPRTLQIPNQIPNDLRSSNQRSSVFYHKYLSGLLKHLTREISDPISCKMLHRSIGTIGSEVRVCCIQTPALLCGPGDSGGNTTVAVRYWAQRRSNIATAASLFVAGILDHRIDSPALLCGLNLYVPPRSLRVRPILNVEERRTFLAPLIPFLLCVVNSMLLCDRYVLLSDYPTKNVLIHQVIHLLQ